MPRKEASTSPKFDVIGLDLSLTNSAAVWIPWNWEVGNWEQIDSTVCGYSLPKNPDHVLQQKRIDHICNTLSDFCTRRFAPHIAVEDTVAGMSAFQGLRLAKLAGAVERAIREETGVSPFPVNVSTARKTFLCKLPKKDRAVAVHEALRKLGCPWEGSDRGDALIIASHFRSTLGLPAMTLG